VPQVRGQKWYSDPAGSQIDRAALARHQALIRPLRDFVGGLLHEIEMGDAQCANSNLGDWASADALLIRPESFEGIRERLRFSIAIDLAALRVASKQGALAPEIVSWLHALNAAVVTDFQRRGIHDNLQVWSGVAASLGWRLTGDVALKQYGIAVWRSGNSAVSADGTVASERRRGTRAILYHGYYAAGLLMLREALAGNGRTSSEIPAPALERLIHFLSSVTCDKKVPRWALLAGAQESLQPSDAAVIDAFDGRHPGARVVCTSAHSEYVDLLGGDLETIKRLLEGPTGPGATNDGSARAASSPQSGTSSYRPR
jgi:hypothetical protein